VFAHCITRFNNAARTWGFHASRLSRAKKKAKQGRARPRSDSLEFRAPRVYKNRTQNSIFSNLTRFVRSRALLSRVYSWQKCSRIQLTSRSHNWIRIPIFSTSALFSRGGAKAVSNREIGVFARVRTRLKPVSQKRD